MVSHVEGKVIRILEEGMVSPAQLANMLGRGYTELKVQSMVLTLARKGHINKTKAALLLRGTPMVKWINEPICSGLKGNIPERKRI